VGAPEHSGAPGGHPLLSSRLIPWCLAATGFLAALTVFTWQGELGGAGQGVRRYAAAAQRLPPPAVEHHEFRSSQAPAASEAPETVPETLILPLPPATQPEPYPNVQPVPDDEPAVEDLPAQRRPPESSGDE
jgi:hypothetical protein